MLIERMWDEGCSIELMEVLWMVGVGFNVSHEWRLGFIESCLFLIGECFGF